MSVIAYDGRSMAGDQQGTWRDSAVRVDKVFGFEGVMYGCAGDYEDGLLFRQWVESGQHPADKPDLEDFCVLVAVPGEDLHLMTERLVPVPLQTDRWAIGSGGDFARGAMAAGASAERAVEIACELCLSCGLGVAVLGVKKRRGKQ